jgi:hypothetical protein
MHDALGDALAVEVLHLLEELDVLHEDGAPRAGGESVLARDRGAVGGREDGALVAHADLLRFVGRAE